jgi:hypothetical protein
VAYKTPAMRKFLLLLLMLSSSVLFSQTPVSVADNTVKIGAWSEQVFYYGFAEGDQVIFTMIETSGKDVKEVEIFEYPSSSIYTDYKTSRVDSKTIRINKTAVYKFRLKNSALGGRVCKIQIQRIPASGATKNFNTTVYWKTVSDSTYTTVEEKYVEKSDTVAVNFLNQTVKVPGKQGVPVASNNNRSIIEVALPENTIAWAYYIGAGDEGKEAHYDGREKFISNAACGENKMQGYGAMAAMAITGKNYFDAVNNGNRIKYWFINDYNNALLFQQEKSFLQYKQGNVVNEASRMKQPLQGKTYLGFVNENTTELEVLVKATAVTVLSQYNTRTVQRLNVNTRQEPYLKN